MAALQLSQTAASARRKPASDLHRRIDTGNGRNLSMGANGRITLIHVKLRADFA
jgi:hypothetical protein